MIELRARSVQRVQRAGCPALTSRGSSIALSNSTTTAMRAAQNSSIGALPTNSASTTPSSPSIAREAFLGGLQPAAAAKCRTTRGRRCGRSGRRERSSASLRTARPTGSCGSSQASGWATSSMSCWCRRPKAIGKPDSANLPSRRRTVRRCAGREDHLVGITKSPDLKAGEVSRGPESTARIPLRDVVRAAGRDAREAEPQLAFAGLVDVERLAADEGDRLGERVRLHLRRLEPSGQPAPQIQPAVGHRPLQLARRAVALERADHGVAPAPMFGPQVGEMPVERAVGNHVRDDQLIQIRPCADRSAA